MLTDSKMVMINKCSCIKNEIEIKKESKKGKINK